MVQTSLQGRLSISLTERLSFSNFNSPCHVIGYKVGHPLVSQLLKGVHRSRPPQPRYNATWDVIVVLEWMRHLGQNAELSLQDLTPNLIILIALSSTSSDLADLDITE